MHGPDGTDFINKTKYLEVVQYSRLVYDHGGNDERPPLFRATVDFTETDGRTKIEIAMAFTTPEVAIEMNQFIKMAGGEATWDRLAEYVSPVDRFVINRSFKLSRDRMFEMWTDPNHLSKWLPPLGFTMKFIQADIRPGGSTHYSMSNDGGMIMYGKANYLSIQRPNRVVYTQVFCDENEKVSRHPAAPTWPETMHTTVQFSEEDQDQTRVTIVWEVHGEATPLERETFHQAKAGMTLGWTGSFDKLEEYTKSLA
jgi:uncharacterized protein YndB with AHSA1/START domain